MKAAAKKNKRMKPIFWIIFSAMIIVVLLQLLLLAASIWLTNVSGRLDENAKDMLSMQVRNRTSYLQDMLNKAQDLSELEDEINATAEQMLADGSIDLATLDDNTSQSDALLEAIAPALVETMRSKPVTGIFVVLNTQDLDDRGVGTSLPGVYLRDLDPDARASDRNTDLLMLRGSAALIKKLGITTDSNWKPTLSYLGQSDNGFLQRVFKAAYNDGGRLNAEDYGRWTTSTYRMVKDDYPAIAYSQPLILSDGTVYGVVGVEILSNYLQSKLPYSELQENNVGTYFLASSTSDLDGDSIDLVKAITSSEDARALDAPAEKLHCTAVDGDGYWLEMGGRRYYGAVGQLQLYNRNAPFSYEQWVLVGTVDTSDLFSFSHTVERVLSTAMLLSLAVGLFGCLAVASTLARPTVQLYHEVAEAQDKHTFPQLSRTGVLELDRLADAFTRLNSDLVNSSTKFLRIMDMASVELGGYELRFDTGSVYVTDNFFRLIGQPERSADGLTLRSFRTIIDHMRHSPTCRAQGKNQWLLTVQQDGATRYIMLRVMTETDTEVGLAEDVTATTLERMRIEHERDYDILTGLYNRQAMQTACDQLFEQPEQLGCAALLMLDLDNLKHINDTYGHDWGDQYIRQTGQCFADNTPPGTICARLSGDEFLVLFYGYRSHSQIRERIEVLRAALQSSAATLPDGGELRISISGGVAWYPDDGKDLQTLKKYADFALYQVKRTEKGRLCEFDRAVYEREAQEAQMRHAFQRLLREENVYYMFQPIFNARTGKVMAYEALMRSNLPELRSPATIMKIAREQGALYEIERLTFTKSMESFQDMQQRHLVRHDAMLFVNSVASVNLSRADWAEISGKHARLLRQVVIEITEEEELNLEALEAKRHMPGFSGMFALDDYGSGYSNEGSLLELAPCFIKVDISIIRGIDTDPDKQQLMKNIVAYAHPRSMKIIAEGVETQAEMEKVIELGADMLQGYFLARPAQVPPELSSAARQAINAKRDYEM